MTEFVDPSPNVVRNMRALRKSHGWSARHLAELLTEAGRPTSQTVVFNHESIERERAVHVDLLAALAHVFQVPIERLLQDVPDCDTCDGSPPIGFTCRACGAEA